MAARPRGAASLTVAYRSRTCPIRRRHRSPGACDTRRRIRLSAVPHAAAAPPAEDPVTSNISQAYPYSSESEAERAAAVAAIVAARAGLDATLANESSPLDTGERWWTYHHGGCGGTLHAAGYAHDRHAVYVVCDRCGKTALR